MKSLLLKKHKYNDMIYGENKMKYEDLRKAIQKLIPKKMKSFDYYAIEAEFDCPISGFSRTNIARGKPPFPEEIYLVEKDIAKNSPKINNFISPYFTLSAGSQHTIRILRGIFNFNELKYLPDLFILIFLNDDEQRIGESVLSQEKRCEFIRTAKKIFEDADYGLYHHRSREYIPLYSNIAPIYEEYIDQLGDKSLILKDENDLAKVIVNTIANIFDNYTAVIYNASSASVELAYDNYSEVAQSFQRRIMEQACRGEQMVHCDFKEKNQETHIEDTEEKQENTDNINSQPNNENTLRREIIEALFGDI